MVSHSISKLIQPIEIIAIEGRSPEGDGMSRPFRCLDEQGREFYVKLKNAGYDSLVKEWICGRLAQEMQLRCANIFQVRIPAVLIAGNNEYEKELGQGIAFASEIVKPCVPLALDYVRDDPHGKLSAILLFDWWIRNSDRSLTDIGGNPNLLWRLENPELVMIDHDNAFDSHFDPECFWKFHALRAHTRAFEPQERQKMTDWLETSSTKLSTLWDELPLEWLDDPHGDPRISFTKESLQETLCRPIITPEEFWTV